MPVASLTDSNAVMAWTASAYYSIMNAMMYWVSAEALKR